jgi:hypothetical protein
MKWRSDRRYRRLPGRPFSVFSRASLWLGEDHLLSVQSNRFSEDYRRYYLRDIQAFIVQRTGPLSLWAYSMGAVAAALLAPGLFFNFQKTFLWISGGLFVAITVYVIALGPTCSCSIQTAVSREQLRSLRWARTAEKTLRIVQPRIEQTQGPMTAEIVALRAKPSETLGQVLAPPPLPANKRPDSGWGYALLFVLLLLDALHSYVSISVKGMAMNLAGWTLLVGEMVCVVWLTVRLRRYDIPAAIRTLVIAALIVTAGLTYTANVLATFERQRHQDFTPATVLVENYPGYVPLHVTAIAADSILAAAGLLLVVRYRRTLRRPPPLAAPE